MGNFVGSDDGEQDDQTEEQVDRRASMAADLNEMLDDSTPTDSEQALLDRDQQDLGLTDDTDTAGEVTQPPAEEQPEVYKLGDMEIPADQIDTVIGLLNWASSLTEEQAARVMAAMNDTPPATPTPPTPPAPAEPEVPEFIAELEAVDPTVAKAMRELYSERQQREAEMEAQLAQYREELNQLESFAGQELATRTKAQTDSAEELVATEFLDKHNLTADDYPALVATAGQLGITDAFVQQFGLEEGFRKTLEAALYANEDLRARTVSQAVQANQAAATAASRKEAASGLGVQGGTNIPRQDVANLPQSDRRKAMVRDIETLMGM